MAAVSMKYFDGVRAKRLVAKNTILFSLDIQLPTQPLDIASLKNTATKMTTGNGSGLPETPSAVALPVGAMAAPSSGNTVSLLRGIRAKSSKESANNNNFSNNNNNNFVSKVI